MLRVDSQVAFEWEEPLLSLEKVGLGGPSSCTLEVDLLCQELRGTPRGAFRGPAIRPCSGAFCCPKSEMERQLPLLGYPPRLPPTWPLMPAPSSSGHHLGPVMFSASPPTVAAGAPSDALSTSREDAASLAEEQSTWLWAQIPLRNLCDDPKEPFHLKATVTLRGCLVWPVLAEMGKLRDRSGLQGKGGLGEEQGSQSPPQGSPPVPRVRLGVLEPAVAPHLLMGGDPTHNQPASHPLPFPFSRTFLMRQRGGTS